MSSFNGGMLFDLDGTLVDTAPDFIRAANELRKRHGCTALAPEAIAEQVSNGAVAVTRVTFGIDEQHAQFDARRQELLDSYEQHLGAAAVLYPGLNELLAQLEQQAIPWGVVTNKPERYAQPLLERLALDQRCSVLVCPDHIVDRKPHPEGLLLGAKKISRPAADCIYVGDHVRDIEAGRAAGMHTIAAAFGYLAAHDDPATWRADQIAASPAMLCEQLLAKIQR